MVQVIPLLILKFADTARSGVPQARFYFFISHKKSIQICDIFFAGQGPRRPDLLTGTLNLDNGQSTSLPAMIQGSRSAAARHSTQAGSACTASIYRVATAPTAMS